jgi:hypothetical protein
MSLYEKPAPRFDRSFLIELGGGACFRQAEKLFEVHAVESAEWESPILKGRVNQGAEIYTPELNLRSTVFAKNSCQCADGRKGKVCVHAIAVALHYEALRQEVATAAAIEASDKHPAAPEAESVEPLVRSIKLADEGVPLRLLIFLPPNLEAAAGARRDCG